MHLGMSLGAGSFCRDFTEKKSPQCRAYTWALQMEKSISPLFPGPEGAVVANDWCIIIIIIICIIITVIKCKLTVIFFKVQEVIILISKLQFKHKSVSDFHCGTQNKLSWDHH